jgi:predicted phage replisome organizer
VDELHVCAVLPLYVHPNLGFLFWILELDFMSDNKNYYYLKLKENFFDSEEIRLLESIENGYLYSNILLKMYLRSLKNEGRLMFKENIPYNFKMLAAITGHNIDVVKRAIEIFIEFGLVQVLDNGAIYIADIQSFIGESSTEADRKRSYRLKIAEEKKSLGHLSGHLSDISPPELDLDLELDLKKEKNHSSSGDERGSSFLNSSKDKNQKSKDEAIRSFNEFWAAYPRKQGKKPAQQRWKAREFYKLLDVILSDIEFRMKHHKPNGWLDPETGSMTDGQFIPLPATYLNQERWEDEQV